MKKPKKATKIKPSKRLTKEQIKDKVRKTYPESDGFGGKDWHYP